QHIYDLDFRVLRSTAVYAQSEELEVAEEPIKDPVCGGKSNTIELDGFYKRLQTGRWVIVSGESGHLRGKTGVRISELVMLADISQKVKKSKLRPDTKRRAPLAGDRIHSFLQLSDQLAYCYKRDTVKIYGNVVKATHGETRNETLGGGDASKASPQFTL